MWPLHTGTALPGVLDAIGDRHVVYLGSGGVQDLTMAEQAELVRVIGEVLGRPLRWVELPRAEARTQLLADGLPKSFVDVLLDVHAVMPRRPEVTTAVADVTGRPAHTFAEWVSDHKGQFGKMRV
jgi:hypothetical protein